MKKAFLVSAGCTSLTLGVVGIFVPLLPTTPFLLLASACFIRSSDRLYRWLIHHRILGDYIYYYMQYRAVSFRAKAFSITMLWLVIGYSAVMVVHAVWVRILLLAIAVGVTLHLLTLRTLTEQMRKHGKEH